MATVKWPTRYDARDPGAERSITAEPHTVGEDLANSVMLFEVPRSDVPSSVVVTKNGTALTEVTGAPAQGEFKVTYTGNLAGLIEFNALDNGAEILVDYNGRGSNLFSRDVNNLQTKKLDADGTMGMSGPMDATLFKVSGTTVIDATRVLQNVTLSGNLITSGTIVDARLSTNVALLNSRPRFSQGTQIDTNIFVHAPGGTAGWARGLRFLESNASGFGDTDPAFGGIGILGTATGGTSVIQKLYMAHGTSPWQSNLGIYILPDGKTGIMTSSPNQALDVVGNGNFSGSVTATSFSGSGTSLTALNATNLTSGTVADARLSTNVALKNGNPTFSAGMTVQNTLTAQGPVVLSGASLTIGNAIERVANVADAHFFRNLCMYDNGVSGVVGALVITTSIPASSSRMMQIRVKGYLYDATSPFDLTIGFYHYATPTPHEWTNFGYTSVGAHVWQVRGAETPDGKICVLLDDVGSVHNYPKLWVAEAMTGHGSASQTDGDGWSISLVTDLTGYTVITNVPNVTTLDWAQIAGTPTTRAGYGITDAASFGANTFTAQQSIVRTLTGDAALAISISGDNNARLVLRGGGAIEWGPGGTTGVDTNLYRSSANLLATDDTFSVRGGNLQVLGGASIAKIVQIQNMANTGYHTASGFDNFELTASIGGSVIIQGDAAQPALRVAGQATQSADLQRWESKNAVLSVVTKEGWLGLGKVTAATALDVAGSGTFSGTVTASSFSGSGANLTALAWGHITGAPTTVAGYGITDAVKTALATDWNISSATPQFVATQTDAPVSGTSYIGVHMSHPQGIYATQFAGRNGIFYGRSLENGVWGIWNKFWHDGNDGAGSTLDADLLDGQDGSYYRNATNINAGTLSVARLPTVVARTDTQPIFAFGIRTANSYVKIDAPTGTAGWGYGLAFYESDESVQFGGVGMLGSAVNGASVVTNIYLAHGATPYNSGLGVYVLPSGNVGIKKTNPGVPLDVNGNTAIAGTLAVTGTITQGGTAVALSGASYTKAEADGRYAVIGLTSIHTFDGSTDATKGRTVDRPTSDYKQTLTAELKTRSSLAIPGSGTYASLLTISTYIDSSAGDTAGQFAFAGGVVSFRSGTIGSAWSAWKTFAMAGDSYTKSEADGRYLHLTGGTLTGAVTMANTSVAQIFPNNARLVGKDTSGNQSGEFIPAASDGGTYVTMSANNTFVVRNTTSTLNCMTVDGSGNVTAAGDVTAFSDRRFKTDLQLIGAASSSLAQLHAYTFTRTDTGQRGLGLIAQDVQNVFPEVVHMNASGELTLAYGNLVAPLIVGHNEHSARFTTVEAELTSLQSRVAWLEAELMRLQP